MRLCENEDCVIMRLLRNREVDGMCQCHGKSFKAKLEEFKCHQVQIVKRNGIRWTDIVKLNTNTEEHQNVSELLNNPADIERNIQKEKSHFFNVYESKKDAFQTKETRHCTNGSDNIKYIVRGQYNPYIIELPK